MRPGLRKLALTAHVTSSVGWLGAVAAFLALAISGLTGSGPERVRAAYLAMDVMGWYVIVPFSFASLLSGLVQALGTSWGLFRHYWIVAKLSINVVASALLLLHLRPATYVANIAAQRALADGELLQVRTRLVADAGLAVLALLVATTLSVYKPRGLTPYGRRREPAVQADAGIAPRMPLWVYFVGIVTIVLLVIVRHLTGGGHRGHLP